MRPFIRIPTLALLLAPACSPSDPEGELHFRDSEYGSAGSGGYGSTGYSSDGSTSYSSGEYVTSSESGEIITSGGDDGCGDESGSITTGGETDDLLPRAPDAMRFGWQNLQSDFHTECTDEYFAGCVTLAVGELATCYAAANGEMRCAGEAVGTTWGTSFVDSGIDDAMQIMFDQDSWVGDDSMCVLAGGVLRCMGNLNDLGQYGVGHTDNLTSLTQWGDLSGLERFAWNNTSTRICAVDAMSAVHCTGRDPTDMTPTPHDSPEYITTAASFWLTWDATLHTDTSETYRQDATRFDCPITDEGFVCLFDVFGTPGHIVSSAAASHLYPYGDWQERGITSASLLNDVGEIDSYEEGDDRIFNLPLPRPVLAMSSDKDGINFCAVLNDGSLWCHGHNNAGSLGTGDTDPVTTMTEVQPPGSVRIACPS